jgi:hypothetical protein
MINPGPSALSVSSLLKSNCEYRGADIQKFSDLMDPSEFEKRKGTYLQWRAIERHPAFGKIREARIASSCPPSQLAGLINFLAAATFSSSPAVIAPSSDPQYQYWISLNDDADGCGNSLTEVARNALVESLVQGRAYLSIDFPDADDMPDLATQKQAGALDARVCFIGAKQVDDWGEDDEGRLLWARSVTVDRKRTTIYGPADTEVTTWTYITPTFTQQYVASRSLDANGNAEPWPEGAVATAQPAKTHNLGCLPLIAVDAPHIVKQLAPLALSIFNCESAADWHLSQSAYSQMVIQSSKTDMSDVVSSEMTAIVLPDGNVSFPSPNPAHYMNLSSAADKKVAALYMALQSLILSQSAKASGPRQSGYSKELEFTQIAQLLSVFSMAIKEALRSAVSSIQLARHEIDSDIQLVGLDKFDLLGLDSKLDLVERILPLPLPDSVKRFAISDLAVSLTAQAPAAMRQQVQQDAANMEVEAPASAIPPPPENIDTTEGTTEEGS